MNPIYRFQFGGATSNLLNPFAVVDGLLNTTTGIVETSSSRSTSGFIEVETGNDYVLMTSDNTTRSGTVCYYRADKSFISGEYGRPFILPNGTKYIRVSFMRSYLPDVGVFQSSVIYYEPYGTYIAHPLYNNSLEKSFEKESNQQFFRPKLSGSLQFVGPDYDMIVSKAFDHRFTLEIRISYNAGQSWNLYWQGVFYKTNCKFNNDSKVVTVTPDGLDQYNEVLAGLEKEWNLLELTPEIQTVPIVKRPCLQIYVEGSTSVGQIIPGSNTYWETECEILSATDISNMHFGKITEKHPISLRFWDSPADTQKNYYVFDAEIGYGTYNLGGAYSLQITEPVPETGHYKVLLTRLSDNAQWKNDDALNLIIVTLSHIEGTGTNATQNVNLESYGGVGIHGRLIFDKNAAGSYSIDNDDKVFNNRNYKYCLPWPTINDSLVTISFNTTTTPTKYGIYKERGLWYIAGVYYTTPDSVNTWVPVAPNTWGNHSTWLNLAQFISVMGPYEQSYSTDAVLKHAYPLASVISVLLGKIAPDITHDDTVAYSQFLYGTNPFTGSNQSLLIAPKSNVITLGYDQPAQKAPITLKDIMDMLRDCYRCYWFIDEQKRFRIEHIAYFQKGGSYLQDAQVGINLTEQTVSRNGKEWAFAVNKYQYDKPEMTARYQFGWMDKVTQLFEGYPIDIISGYVNPEKIEQVNVSKFTSDIDFILLAPDEISKDGFVLLGMSGEHNIYDYTFVQGSLVSASAAGTPYAQMLNSNTNRITTPLINISGSSIKIVNKSTNYKWFIFFFDANGNYTTQRDGWNTGDKTITITAPKMAIVVAYTNDLTITPSQKPTGIVYFDANIKVPIVTITDGGINYGLQNGNLSFAYLQQFYAYDMPAWKYAINGVQKTALGVKKLKLQELNFPALQDPDLLKLIKTNLGDGMIQKLSVNLSSRNANATLKYDTE